MQIVNKWVSGSDISNLTPEEINDPMRVLKSFCAEFPLLAMKEFFSTMTDLCVMAEDVLSKQAKTRQPLFDLSARTACLLEAVYLITRKENPVSVEAETSAALPVFRHVRVLRTRGRISKPLLTFCGAWLYLAGFHIGDQVCINIEAGRLTLTVSKQWNRTKQEWRIRA